MPAPSRDPKWQLQVLSEWLKQPSYIWVEQACSLAQAIAMQHAVRLSDDHCSKNASQYSTLKNSDHEARTAAYSPAVHQMLDLIPEEESNVAASDVAAEQVTPI